ncbi:MAG: amidophosphoribosyltransferase [Stomatobaculum sp.]|nr:amidophosphoribosyltransferase [Stomatobaculum sp.]
MNNYTDYPHEECGVFGLCLSRKAAAAPIVYHGLYALQHRGQESCGIIVNHRGLFSAQKGPGLVGEFFTPEVLSLLPEGKLAVGHVRYSTTGDARPANFQPLEVNHLKGRLAIAHNGNLSNAAKLRKDLELSGAIFHTTSDTETIAYIITRERLRHPSIEDAVEQAMYQLEGAYSLVLMSASKLIAVRDPHGFRPLCFGELTGPVSGYVVASETCALDAVGAHFVRELLPGEMLIFDGTRMESRRVHCGRCPHTACAFEYIYFSRPDSMLNGVSVHEARKTAGRLLWERCPAEADLVLGAPDSGLDAALGFSEASGIPYEIGLIKNKYIGRTFILPGQENRKDQVSIKLNPVRSVIEGKRLVLVDDSIVRGTTSRLLLHVLREAGAKEIHMRISSPPFRGPCYYGTDIDSKEHLIATGRTLREMAEFIGADSLGFLEPEDLKVMADTDFLCDACFTENYPTRVPQDTRKDRFEAPLPEN